MARETAELIPPYFGRERRTSSAAPMATAQTGAMVIRNGRMVSLAECDPRSKAPNTITVPSASRINPATKAGHLNARIAGQSTSYSDVGVDDQ